MPSDFDPLAAALRRASFTAVPTRFVDGQELPISEAIDVATRLVALVRADRPLVRLLAVHGFTLKKIEEGLALQAAAEEMVEACRSALALRDAAKAKRDEAWTSAKEEYLDFRAVARASLHNVADLASLGIAAPFLPQLNAFVAQALGSYRAAQRLSSARILASEGFSPGRISDAVNFLGQLTDLEALVVGAESRLRHFVDEREMAIVMLNLWVRDLLKAMRVALGKTRRPPSASAAKSAERVTTRFVGQRFLR